MAPRSRLKIVRNAGGDRVIDLVRPWLTEGGLLDLVTPSFSLFAFAELAHELSRLAKARVVLPGGDDDLGLVGADADRGARNRLQTPWLARRCADWLSAQVEVRRAAGRVPQGTIVLRDSGSQPQQVLLGSLAFSTDGLGLTPGNTLNLIQASEGADESALLSAWFDAQWQSLAGEGTATSELVAQLRSLSAPRAPFTIYTLMLHHLFSNSAADLDEDRVVNSATGIRNTVVWKKLFRFQRDGVVGALDKLNRYGGCIIADSVGLGKTFEALAIIKYHELRNDRVLVLCPKRLRDNWTIYKANDRRNVLATDRFNYDVLNHTDLSRDGGMSGDIDLSHVNWGNYDLVVIDESHNFRNKQTPRQGGETRYDRLMRRIVKEGVKTRVLMLSATPVNNRLADLRNQIAFATEGDDTALAEQGIASIDSTTRLAQKQFNRWLEMDDADRTPTRLIDMLGFDYFTLLDLLTIARSRKHIEKYYGTEETSRFPDRLKPINIKADVDRAGEFRSIRDINLEIRRLTLAAYAPLRYVLPHKQAAYDAKYSTRLRGGEGFFRQVDREESLIHLLRVNVLKRMESAVPSFTLTVGRQLEDVEATLAHIDAHADEVEEIDIADVDIEDPQFESLLVGRKVKVLLKDVDLIRWRQDLIEDRNRLAALHDAARQVNAARDAKLDALRTMIDRKCRAPINPGNRKVVVFTAFADTARYLYDQLAPWAKDTLGVESALVTGAGRNQTTLAGLRKDLGSILTTFSPRSKERPEELAGEGELDLLIATDCISEGQNLQDCDWLINYDIHWNPVRIIQRFGRIDRIGSPNERIQLVNFWPNIELEEYINLEQRVSGRMVLLDISATGEENLIEQQSGNQMNDLEYRRKQLLKLQDAVIDLEDLSTGVTMHYGKGYSSTNLRYFRTFYQVYAERTPEIRHMPCGESGGDLDAGQIRHTPRGVLDDLTLAVEHADRIRGFSPRLGWSHHRALMNVENKAARLFYEIEAEKSGWSVNHLERQIHTLLFARLLKSRNKAGLLNLANEGQVIRKPADVLKDPYVLDFLDLPDDAPLHESDLEAAIIGSLQEFLLELGKGFAFVARQKRLAYDDEHFYVDLVFYNCILKCYVLIDLKIGRLTHQDIGQMDSYVRLFDDRFTTAGDKPTIGLILCAAKNEAVARYSVLNQNKQVFAARYMKVLPTEAQLASEIERERRVIEARRVGKATPL